MIRKTWGNCAKVLSIAVTGSGGCFMKSGELQRVRGCAFPLGREMWKHTCAVCGVGGSGSGRDLPQGCVRSGKGALSSGAEWLELVFWVCLAGFSSAFSGCQLSVRALATLGAAPLSLLIWPRPVFRRPQLDTRPSAAPPGCPGLVSCILGLVLGHPLSRRCLNQPHLKPGSREMGSVSHW